MLGFLGIFGRAREIQLLDEAVRAVDLHPRLVPDAVKLTTVKLLKEAHGPNPDADAIARAAELLGYCMLGPSGFAAYNDPNLCAAVEARMEAAIQSGDSLDARLILLTVHANVIQPSVIDRFGIEVG